MTNLVQTAKGDFELEGKDGQGVGFLSTSATFFGANAFTTQVMMVAQRSFRIKGIVGRVNVAGTDGGAVTATVYKAPSGTAIASGTALHSGTFNLKGTAATNQTLTLSTTDTDLDIAAGDTIGVVVTGVTTTVMSGITVHLAPR